MSDPWNDPRRQFDGGGVGRHRWNTKLDRIMGITFLTLCIVGFIGIVLGWWAA